TPQTQTMIATANLATSPLRRTTTHSSSCNSPASLRRLLARQAGCFFVIALLARKERLQAYQIVVLGERQQLWLARGKRVLALEYAQHRTHALRGGKQRD